jgi:hypothetical protein
MDRHRALEAVRATARQRATVKAATNAPAPERLVVPEVVRLGGEGPRWRPPLGGSCLGSPPRCLWCCRMRQYA